MEKLIGLEKELKVKVKIETTYTLPDGQIFSNAEDTAQAAIVLDVCNNIDETLDTKIDEICEFHELNKFEFINAIFDYLGDYTYPEYVSRIVDDLIDD